MLPKMEGHGGLILLVTVLAGGIHNSLFTWASL